jgi:putative ABC transport system permease protein
MDRLWLYTKYAVRSFRRGGVRSLFGAFCVAVGVAAIVALELVGANFRATITGNAQKINRGDVSVTAWGTGMTTSQYAAFARLKRQGAFVDYTSLITRNATVRKVGGDPTNVQFVGADGIDPATFPFYDRITADKPAGVPLSRLITNRQDTVVSEALASSLDLHIGDRIYAGFYSHNRTYRVTGIIPDSSIPGQNIFALNTYFVVDYRSIQPFTSADGDAANTVYIKTANAAQAAQVKRILRAKLGNLFTIKTAQDVGNEDKKGADQLNRFLTIMGLVAVVIGGIGIVNTMLVAARRRRREIAILKTLGMKGHQVIMAFTIEALVLGLLGALFGIGGGILASIAVNSVAQGIILRPLVWELHAGPIIIGLLVGLIFTVLFAFLPVQHASQVRPIAALREAELDLQQPLGKLVARTASSGLTILALAIVMGIVAAFFIGFGRPVLNVFIGIGMGIGVLIALTFLTLLFVGVVWIISKLPTLRLLTLRLALRNMTRQKRRMASTLLALCIGILAVGSIAIIAQNIKADIGLAAAKDNSFNAVIFSSLKPGRVAQISHVVDQLPGIVDREYAGVSTDATLANVDGRPVRPLLEAAARHPHKYPFLRFTVGLIKGVQGRDLKTVGKLTIPVVKGRTLGPQDSDTDHIIVNDSLAKPLGIHIGSHLLYTYDGRILHFTVVGLENPNCFCFDLAGTIADTRYLQQVGALAPNGRNYSTVYLQIADKDLKTNIKRLRRSLPYAFVFDLSGLLPLFNKLIDQFALFPEIIGGLCLFAGAVIIANTVALAMLERRREIGIMKAVGAKQRFILQQLLAENALVGFFGALVGTLLAMLATVLLDTKVLGISVGFDWLVIVGLLALGTLLAMGAAILTAWPASREKPLLVLRYE